MQTVIEDIRAGRWRRPALLAGATVLTFAMVLALARLATAPTLEMMFARLDAETSARVLQELEARGIAHELRGDAIWVDGAMRDRLRLDLAAEGLPGSDGAGYELLDGLSGFGTTTQMFDAALSRAREGELARTLLAGQGVEAARVHIAAARRSPFSRDGGATASVTLQMRVGPVPPALAEAAQSLVSGAVPGLAAAGVSVVDARTGRVVSQDGPGRQDAAHDERLAQMRAAVDRLLTARVGAGRFVAEVALETSRAEEVTRERVLDPASRVAVSTETSETQASGSEAGGQGVTVASNLPDGDAAGDGGSQSTSAETRERVAYDVSAREREVTRGAGAVERITVAVMVDEVAETEADGRTTWTPRTDVELQAIAALVQSAVGFREDRGDVVTVRSLRFEAVEIAELETPSAPWLTGAQMVRSASVLGLALAVAAMLGFVVRPMLSARAAEALPDRGVIPLEGTTADARALPAPPSGATSEAQSLASAETGALPDLGGLPALGGLPPLDAPDGAIDDPVERLRALIADRREETVDVLRRWIEEPTPEEAR